MKIDLAEEYGFCNGVTRALKLLDNELKHNKKIYLYGDIIHNDKVMDKYKDYVIILKKETNSLKNIKDSTIIMQAHGSSEADFKLAKMNNNKVIDATCPLVNIINQRIKEYTNKGYDIIYIGHQNHDEAKATLTYSNKIHLVTTINDLDTNITNPLIYVTNQSTLSLIEIDEIYNKIKEVYPQAIIDNKICLTSTKRQSYIINNHKYDLIIVVGDKKSSNTRRLYEISSNYTRALYIEDVNELKTHNLSNYSSVLLVSGASTPKELVLEVKDFLESLPK